MAIFPAELLPLIQALKANGYGLILVGVLCPLKKALELEAKRSQETGRSVPYESIVYTYEHFPHTFFALEKYFDSVYVYDNSGKIPQEIMVQIGSDIEFSDEALYNEFRERGGRK